MNAPRVPIAIVGMGCRFPHADGIEAFWELLRTGTDAISEVPASRWDADALWSKDGATPGKTYCRWGGFVSDGDQFDAALFDLSEREAAFMDPQQGLVLECAWQALEAAGIAPQSLRGTTTGTFVGISNCDFDRKLCSDLDNLELLAGTGTSYSIVANRLAYVLGLCGPSIAVDLACASSLVSVHLACQSLWMAECDLALAGGTHLILSAEKTITFSRGNALARDGRCKSFAANADGYVRGEGCGMIVLKRLEDAQRDQDPIIAVIRGCATNHNGASNGLSAPLGVAQERVIRAACASAGIEPNSIGYVEAHSPGTSLGDLIEVRALGKVLTGGRSAGQACRLGSVKSNIGHLEGAAGIASLIKAALVVQRGHVPRTLHAQRLNVHLPLAHGVLEVASEAVEWTAQCRRAGVSSFSFGGANAHVLIENAPAAAQSTCEAGATENVLLLSAKSPAALLALADSYERYLSGTVAARFADVCYTAALGRAHFQHRLAVVARSGAEALQQLAARQQGISAPIFTGDAPVRSPALQLNVALQSFDLASWRLPPHLAGPVRTVADWYRAGLVERLGEDQWHARSAELLAALALLKVLRIAPSWVCLHPAEQGARLAQVAVDAQLTAQAAALLGDARHSAGQALTRVLDPSNQITHGGRVITLDLSAPQYALGLHELTAFAYVSGLSPDWQRLFHGARVIPVPTYPFQRRRHWTFSLQPRSRAASNSHQVSTKT